ncbi:pancreatic secretory granule membrane major glycoprotein GP2 isoform X2 [Festucalex cinctus]
MEVVIPSAYFLHKVPPVYVWDLHLNDPDCRGVEVGDDYVFSIKSNLSHCGSIMTSDATHILFVNTIHNNRTDVITRNYINITFVCRYPINYMVQQPNGENRIRVDVRTITLNTEEGNFSVSMLLYKDEAFEDKWTTVPSLTLDDHIFVKVFMIPAHLMLRMERCWATPTKDPYSHIQYTFIRHRRRFTLLATAQQMKRRQGIAIYQEGSICFCLFFSFLVSPGLSCPVLTNQQTLSVLANGRSAEAAFRIQMFKFVGGSYTNVFLHCNVHICHSGPGLCQPNCSSEDVLTRTRRDIPLSHTVSYGPIRRRVDSEDPRLGAGGPPPVETFILGGFLVVLLLVAGVFGRLWIRSRRFYPMAREAQLTLSNVQHISQVAS